MAHILILTPQLPVPPQALTGFSQGTTIRNFSLVAGLARRHEVDLLAFLPADEPGEAANSERQVPSAGPRADGPDPVALLQPYCRQIVTASAPRRTLAVRGRDTLLSPLPDMALRLASAAMRDHMARLLAENRYDVIQVEGIEMAPYLLGDGVRSNDFHRREPKARPRWIFDDHNAEYLLQKRACLTDLRRPRRWLAAAYSLAQWQKLAAYERRICRQADRVIAVSEADRQALRALLPGLDVTVIPNGVDLAFFRPNAVPPMPGIGLHALVFVGKMDYRPNVDAVLWFADAVLPLIRHRVPDAHFYAVGQQPHPRVIALAGRPGITVTGRVPDVRPYVAAGQVYVVPLRVGGGTRLKVLEAMAMARPIVSTRLGCDGFQFADGQEAVFADEPSAFADAVVALLLDPNRAAAMGGRARTHVEAQHGWDAILPRLEALYSETGA